MLIRAIIKALGYSVPGKAEESLLALMVNQPKENGAKTFSFHQSDVYFSCIALQYFYLRR